MLELALIKARMSCPLGSFISASYREPNSPLPSLLEIRMVSARISHLLAKQILNNKQYKTECYSFYGEPESYIYPKLKQHAHKMAVHIIAIRLEP